MRGGNGRWIESSKWRSGETGVACPGVRDLLDAGAWWTGNELESNEIGIRFAPSWRRGRPQGGPLMSQLGSAGQCARVRPGRALYCAENSEKEEPCRCQGPDDQMTE